MKEIPLTQGYVALVDDDDYKWLSQYNWSVKHASDGLVKYAQKSHRKEDGRRTIIKMHRLIMDAKPGDIIDHADQNGLNNQRSNLRFATASQNSMNGPKRSRNTSGYIGVSWDKAREKWEAHIKIDKRKKMLGRFDSAEDAAIVRDQAARIHYGEYAVLNFPRD